MTPEMIGLIGLAALLIILALGAPIGAALGLVGLAGLAVLLSPEAALIRAGDIAFETLSRYELGVLPLFMLMAHLCFKAGASRDFFDAASKFTGHKAGGLAVAAIGGCAGFGAISGSSLATAATVGLVALPEMRRANYSPELATGSLAAGGTLGSLTPPSGALIVFGIIAEQSIGKLFAAAIVPVLTQALFYIAVIWLICRIRPDMGPPTVRAPWRERFAALRRVADIGLLILFVLGGLFVGWFTPTEAASVGAALAFLILLLRGQFTWSNIRGALSDTLRTTGMIYLVIIGALVFATFVTVSGIATATSLWVTSLHAGALGTVIAMALALLLLGSVLDGMALMLLTTPIFLPIIHNLGLSPIWFGIFLVRTMEIGLVHPPVGMNVYVIHGIAKDIPLVKIFKGIVPFLLTDFLHLALLIAFPALALALPTWLGMH